jgi:hypothetical protein
MENVWRAKVTGKIADGWDPRLHFVGYKDEQAIGKIGWACMFDVAVGAHSWNEEMRKCTAVYAAWHENGLAAWRRDMKIIPSNFHPVQFTAVYAVRALTDKRAAEMALELLLTGDDGHLEWYDASLNHRWSKLIRQRD